MTKFEFRLPSPDDVRNSANGQIMLNIIYNHYDEKYTLVTGVMGAELEVVAFFRTIRLLNMDKKVLFLSHYKLLKFCLKSLLDKQGIVENCIDLIQNWQYLSKSDVLQSVVSDYFKEYELILFKPNLTEKEFKFFCDTFDRISIFINTEIQLDNSFEAIIKKIISHSSKEFTLQFNDRITYQIYNFKRYFVPNSSTANDSQILSALKRYKNSGELPEVLGFKSSIALLQRISMIIEIYKGFNILLLVPENGDSGVINSFLNGCGQASSILNDETDLSELNSIIITSLRFDDWLPTFDLVICVDFQAIEDTQKMRQRLYHKLSCAKNRLIIMYVGEFPTILKDFPEDVYDKGDLFS